MKATAQTVIIWLFLLFVTGESLHLYFKAQAKAARMEENVKAANESAEEFRAKNGQLASKLTAQELTISELRRINPEIISQLKNLYIPPRLAQSYTQTAQKLNVELAVPVKHSIPEVQAKDSNSVQPTKPIRSLDYSDPWVSVFCKNIDLDTAKLLVSATDSIFISIYKGERRRPGLWILSRRKYQTAATNVNPYISIEVVQSGIIKK
jgi:hypothetical protein